MIKDHFRYLLLGKPYLAVLPGLCIMFMVLAFMTLGNSLRDALDVRS
jgi:peptide/nickel transport system permease protein